MVHSGSLLSLIQLKSVGQVVVSVETAPREDGLSPM